MSKDFYRWENLRTLKMRPKLSFFQQDIFGPIIDGFPTGPDAGPDPDILCLQSPVTVTVENGKYKFGNTLSKYGMSAGTYLLNVPEEHPIAFLNNGKTGSITYSGIQYIDKRAFPALDGNYGYIYVYGEVYVVVSGNFDKISYVCLYHGYEGGQDNLYYKASCTAPPTRTVSCLSKNNDLVITESGEIKIGNNSAPYGLTAGMYNISFDFQGLYGQEHELVFLGDDQNKISLQGDASGFSEEDQLPAFYRNLYPTVYSNFGTVGVKCRLHPNERINDFFVFSPTCTLPLPDDYEYVVPTPPTVIDCFLISYFDTYTVCDENGDFYEPTEYNASAEPPIQPTITVYFDPETETFPYTVYSSTTGITYIAKGLYTETTIGDYKITDPPSGLFPSGYYLLVDLDGNAVLNTNVTPSEYIGIAWNGSTAFPFSGTGIRQAGVSQVISTNVSYNIVGQTLSVIPNCKIKMPIIGTYNDSTIYLVVDENGNELNDPFLVYAGNVADVKVRVFWTESDQFPKIKPPTSGTTGIQYSIVGEYKELDPVFYRAKQSKLGEYSSQTIYTLVNPNNTDKTDPGTNDTTLVTVTLPTDQQFPVIKTPTSAYKVYDYQIINRYYNFVSGEFRIKQKIVNNLPDPLLYYIVDSDDNEVNDPGTNNTTKVEVRWAGNGFPMNVSSVNWFVNVYKIVGKYSQISGDYIMKATPTTGSDNLYLVCNLSDVAVDDPGTNNTTKVFVYWNGNPSVFPLYLTSTTGYFGITYRIIDVQYPKFITVEEYTGPTGISSGATGPVGGDGYYFGNDINPPLGTGPTGPYTGPTTVATGPIITEASGPFEDLNAASINAIVGGQDSVFTLTNASKWLPL